MTQREIVTSISKYLYKGKGGYEFRVSEIIGFTNGRDEKFIEQLPAKSKYSTLSDFRNAVKAMYKAFNPAVYDLNNVVVWLYIEEHEFDNIYIGFNRILKTHEIEDICQMLKATFIEIKPGQFGIITF